MMFRRVSGKTVSRLRRAAAVVGLSSACAASAFAGQTAIFAFLKLPQSARQTALGALNSFFDPDALAFAQNPALALTAPARCAAVSGAGRTDGAYGTFAVSGLLRLRRGVDAAGFVLSLMSSSHEKIAAPLSSDSYLFSEDGTFTTYSVASGGFYAAKIQPTTYFGAGLKLVREQLYSESYTGVTSELSLVETVDPTSFFSIGVRNLGFAFSGAYPTPSSGYLSILKKMPVVSFAIEGEYDALGFGEAKFGLEIPVEKTLELRVGFRHPFKEYDTGDFVLSRISAGFGVKIGGVRFDYAWRPAGDLGTTHLATLRTDI